MATVLRQNGFSTLVIDYMEYWKLGQFFEMLKVSIGENTKFVGWSSTWTQLGTDFGFDQRRVPFKTLEFDILNQPLTNFVSTGRFPAILQYIREINPRTKILVGGTKAPAISKYLADNPDYKGLIDNVMAGYAESTIVKYAQDPDSFGWYISEDPHAMGYDFQTGTTHYTDNDFITPQEILSIECSRGCRFACKFCSFPLIGRKDLAKNWKSKECFRAELMENYEKWGTHKYMIVDDTFNDSTEKLRYYNDVIQSLPFKLSFWCYLRAEMIVNEPEQIDLLRDMGLVYCFFGIETYNHASGKAIGKGMDPDRIKQMLRDCRESWGDNVVMTQGLIFGLPHQNEQDIHDDLAWMMTEDSPIDFAEAQPLFISSEAMRSAGNFVYLSKFDMEYRDWGYTFPHNEPEKMHMWEKDDDTDIKSFQEARELADFYNESLWPNFMKHGKRKKINIFTSAIDDPAYADFNKLKEMTREQQIDLINSLPDYSGQQSGTEVGFGLLIQKHYVKPLLKKFGVDKIY